jgi:hypothetical protein
MRLVWGLAISAAITATLAAQAPRTLHVFGKVLLEGGVPPPDAALVEISCSGSGRGGAAGVQAHTDNKGRFSLDVGDPGIVMDASLATGPVGAGVRSRTGLGEQGNRPSELLGCELRATLPGYRAQPLQLVNRQPFDYPDVGTIVLHRLANIEGHTVSMTSLEAPKDARKAYEKGRDALDRRKPQAAQKELRKSVALYPKYAAAWCALGTALEACDDFAAARDAYGRSLEADSRFIKPHVRLAAIALRESKWLEASESSGQAIKLDPFDTPQAFLFHALANLKLGNLEAAEKSARLLEARSPRGDPETQHLLEIILSVRQAGR